MGMKEQGRPNKYCSALLKHPNDNASPRQKDAIKRMGRFRVYPSAIVTKGGASAAIQAILPSFNSRGKDVNDVRLPPQVFATHWNAQKVPTRFSDGYVNGATVAQLKRAMGELTQVARTKPVASMPITQSVTPQPAVAFVKPVLNRTGEVRRAWMTSKERKV